MDTDITSPVGVFPAFTELVAGFGGVESTFADLVGTESFSDVEEDL